ncbi:lipopolysaccharide assembly protein LapA domain-containing protein [Pseudohongiella spirulinae]|uniref:Lipopolysaccharide assembly protein A domain-containing protein n=1 Tax=Pseudohongiella spirulinae TaxID=1249552 RepID=A0A0S2KD78_9GAMM|nr:lipopolysaccharide assembly protein LapA domain-containing protein [Pseudohongiella spirulinae]ALO46282.1 hypothetical protein PS2015_1630 [Pseudohongiella spirulinae]
MQGLKRWLTILLLLLIVLLSAGFSLWNTVPVPLSFGIVSFADRPLAVWVIAAFCLGGLCGLVLGAGVVRDVRLRLRIRRLEKELASRPRFPPAEREI